MRKIAYLVIVVFLALYFVAGAMNAFAWGYVPAMGTSFANIDPFGFLMNALRTIWVILFWFFLPSHHTPF